MKDPDKHVDHAEREDLDHEPDNAGKVGERHKDLNEGGEQQRPPVDPDQRQAP